MFVIYIPMERSAHSDYRYQAMFRAAWIPAQVPVVPELNPGRQTGSGSMELQSVQVLWSPLEQALAQELQPQQVGLQGPSDPLPRGLEARSLA